MTYDLIIILLIAFSFWRGWRRGLMRILASVVLFFIALPLGSAVGSIIISSIGMGVIPPLLAFFIGFAAIMIVGGLIAKKMQPKKGIFSFLDRIAGAAVSGIRMLLFIGLMCALSKLLHIPSEQSTNESKLFSVSLRASSLLVKQITPLIEERSHELDFKIK